jgi:putative transposase
MQKFQNKYRVPSARKPGYDYSCNGSYFITICTKNRECFFGKIVYGEMQYSKIGEIVRDEILKTPKIRKNVTIDEWIVMPNHIHVIFILGDGINTDADVATTAVSLETTRRVVSTPPNPTPTLKPNSLGSIIGQIKSMVTKYVWKLGYHNFEWQPRFHDHIIRDNGELERIRKYIKNNPANWRNDENYK